MVISCGFYEEPNGSSCKCSSDIRNCNKAKAYDVCSICFRHKTILVKHDCVISICIIPFYLHHASENSFISIGNITVTVVWSTIMVFCSPTCNVHKTTYLMSRVGLRKKINICTGKNINEKNSLTCMVSECKNETLKKKKNMIWKQDIWANDQKLGQYLCKYVIEQVVVVNFRIQILVKRKPSKQLKVRYINNKKPRSPHTPMLLYPYG